VLGLEGGNGGRGEKKTKETGCVEVKRERHDAISYGRRATDSRPGSTQVVVVVVWV